MRQNEIGEKLKQYECCVLYRWKALQISIEDRLKQLQDALRAFGPESQHFLSGHSLLFFLTLFILFYQFLFLPHLFIYSIISFFRSWSE